MSSASQVTQRTVEAQSRDEILKKSQQQASELIEYLKVIRSQMNFNRSNKGSAGTQSSVELPD